MNVPVCSLCGMAYGEVARLFQGEAAVICDECVDVCVQLLQDYKALGLRPPRPSKPWYKKIMRTESKPDLECNFSLHDSHNPQGERIFPGIQGVICDKCVRTCEVMKSDLLLGA